MTSHEELVVAIADRLAIQDLVVLYAKARDTTDADLYRQIFAEDASIGSGSGITMSTDREQILAKVANDQIRFNPDKKPGETRYGVMRHEPSNVSITIDGDTATSDYYIKTLAYNEAEQRPEIISMGRNEDRYEKRDGRWWIVRSTLYFGWEHPAMGRALKIGRFTPPEYRGPALAYDDRDKAN